MPDDKQLPPLPGESAVDYVRRTTAPFGNPVPPPPLIPPARTATPTEDAVRMLPPDDQPKARAWVARVKLAAWASAAVLSIVVPAVVSAVHAIKEELQHLQSGTATKVESQTVKDKAEAGYQVTRQAMQALEARLQQLEQPRHPEPRHRPGTRRTPAPPPPQAAAAKALPADLDKAERQVARGQAPAPAEPPRADAGAKQ